MSKVKSEGFEMQSVEVKTPREALHELQLMGGALADAVHMAKKDGDERIYFTVEGATRVIDLIRKVGSLIN